MENFIFCAVCNFVTDLVSARYFEEQVFVDLHKTFEIQEV